MSKAARAALGDPAPSLPWLAAAMDAPRREERARLRDAVAKRREIVGTLPWLAAAIPDPAATLPTWGHALGRERAAAASRNSIVSREVTVGRPLDLSLNNLHLTDQADPTSSEPKFGSPTSQLDDMNYLGARVVRMPAGTNLTWTDLPVSSVDWTPISLIGLPSAMTVVGGAPPRLLGTNAPIAWGVS